MISLLAIPQAVKTYALAGAFAALALYGLHEHTRAGQWETRSDKNAALYNQEVVKHAVTRQSLDTVQASFADQSRLVAALSNEGVKRTKAADDARTAAQAAGRVVESKARALDASATVTRGDADKCPPSDVFWNQREGL